MLPHYTAPAGTSFVRRPTTIDESWPPSLKAAEQDSSFLIETSKFKESQTVAISALPFLPISNVRSSALPQSNI